MLQGYKTYITAVVAVIGAVAAALTGDMSYADAAQIVVTALIGAFLKNGQDAAAKKAVTVAATLAAKK
jgi:type IV secretory pathway VirB2 component (pilin)